ncbi:MAG TPA: type II toxin-antitoxin system ParD family antitoxin [Acidobacteriaceae bacterium]|nr:type II toxin-antitoxin system ParD family antitoxin [Acidobacteriaceae bacterium]
MANQTTDLTTELNSFAAPLIEQGRYENTAEVLHAAMDALRREMLTEEQENAILQKLAEEGEASGIAEGDVIGRICEKYGLKRPNGI